MKIISGKLRGRLLVGPKDSFIRPTLNRAKEMIFSTLNSILLKNNKSMSDSLVLDCFCGSGALGIEAISRGAKKSIFVDNSTQALNLCKLNCTKLNILDISEFIKSDLENLAFHSQKDFIDIFFFDPPYNKVKIDQILERFNNEKIIKKNAVGIIELPKESLRLELPGFHLLKKKIVSGSEFLFVTKL